MEQVGNVLHRPNLLLEPRFILNPTATTTTGFCAAKLSGNKDNAPFEGFNTGT
jgi:hypothetical protein